MNLNRVIVIGRLTADPVLRSTPAGQSVASLSLATNRVWSDKNGTRREETEYHTVVAWGRQAEIASQFLKKGGLVCVEGRLRTRTWQDKQGQTRKTTEIVSERLQLGPRGSESRGASPAAAPREKEEGEEAVPTVDIGEGESAPEEVPF